MGLSNADELARALYGREGTMEELCTSQGNAKLMGDAASLITKLREWELPCPHSTWCGSLTCVGWCKDDD